MMTLSRREAVRAAGFGLAALALSWRGAGRAGGAQPDGAQPASGPLDGIRGALRDPHAPFTLVIRFELAPGMLERFGALAAGAIAGTALEDGVVQYEFHQSTANAAQFVLIEQWRSLADIEKHFEGAYTQELVGSLGAMLVGPPDLQVFQLFGGRSVNPAPRGSGFYRFSIGNIRATVLSDGHALFRPIHPTFGPTLPKGEVDALLEGAMLDPEGGTVECSPLLLETPEGRVLVDTGAGTMFGPTMGKLGHNLAAAGVRPSEIDAVVLTHGHPDHLGGLFDHGGRVAFPNADVFLGRREREFWMGTPDLSGVALPDEMKAAWVGGAQERLRAYGPRVHGVDAGQRIAGGVSLLDTPGHTPGHCSVLIESGAASVLCTGDVILHHVLGVRRVEAGVVFDSDPTLATRTRRRVLETAAAEKRRLMVYHAPWPGLGRVGARDDAFEWFFEPMQWG